MPDRQNLEPSYEQVAFPIDQRLGKLRLIASPDGRDGSVTVHQDLQLLTAILEPNQQVGYELGVDRSGWLQITQGAILLNGQRLEAGDGVAISAEQNITIEAKAHTEFLLFDLA